MRAVGETAVGWGAAAEEAPCFHCGEPIPADVRLAVEFDGGHRPLCCAGCAAVARTIIENGLGGYYRTRTALARRGPEARLVPDQLRVYDLPEMQETFVTRRDGGTCQAALLVEGITCGACAWLIEQRLRRIPGIVRAAVNLAARRAQIEWDPERAPLSAALQAIADLGYRAEPYDPARSDAAAARERRSMLWRIAIAGLGMMQVMMYAVPAYIADGDLSRETAALLRWASLVLTTPVVAWAAGPFFLSTWRDLRARRAGMDLPVALGIALAFAASVVATVRGGGDVYFDSICMFVFLLLGARYLEAVARAKAADAQQRLVRHVPAVAERLTPGGGGATERVPVARLRPGDTVLVAPGAVVPADGDVIDGTSAADEALVTGESRAVAKQAGDAVIGGSINVRSPLTVRVTRVGQDTRLAAIVRLMDRAQSEKPRLAQLADRVAQWFVVALLAVAAATALAWGAIDPQRALWVVVAVLVVTCPCALSLATPAALTVATGALHRLGVLVTRAHALETLASATHVVFDKTGTLTTGRLSLIGVMPLGGRGIAECMRLAAALEHGSAHPVAQAIRSAAPAMAGEAVAAPRHFPGEGIEADVGRRLRIGSPAFVAGLTRRPPPPEMLFTTSEAMVVALGDADGWIALFTFGDPLRPGAAGLVRALEAQGLTVGLLSGDRWETTRHIAGELGIALFRGQATPQDKLEIVRGLQSEGAVVAMVGDGVNDAPVLAQAQVSIAMGGGTDLAQASADMVLLGDDLERLHEAFVAARRARRVIRQNLAWAAGYNAIAVPLAVAGLVTPLLAGIGMALSSFAVVLNAMRLLRAGGASGRAREARVPALAS